MILWRKQESDRCILENQGYRVVVLTDLLWQVVVRPHPKHTYAGTEILLQVEFPLSYPNADVRLRFLTPLHHPNFLPSGQPPKDLFSTGWANDLWMTMYYLMRLLDRPKHESGFHNHVASRQLKKGEWQQAARAYLKEE